MAIADTQYTTSIEGNKKLSRSINSYLRQRDKITNDIWKKELFPIMKEAKNEILTKLKSFDNLTDWQVYNMSRIMASIQQTVDKMNDAMQISLAEGQIGMAQFASNHAQKEAILAGLKNEGGLALSTQLTEGLIPLSSSFLSNFSKDMSKILNSEISLGLVRGDSVAEVSSKIVVDFGNTERQIQAFKSDKARWDSLLNQGKVTQSEYDRRIRILNKRLEKGSMMSYARAERISRTEILRASSVARKIRQNEIVELNPEAVKAWIHSGNANGRPSHMAAEAEYKNNPIPPNQPYFVGGEQGQYPRDLSFSAKNTVNCGCMSILLNRNEI